MSEECVEDLSIPIVTVREQGKRACFLNPDGDSYQRVLVDDCVITEGIRADWIVRKIGHCSAIVELKGSNVAHACDQLERTFDHPAAKPYLEERVAYLVVSSKSPSFDTKVARAKERAKRRGIRLTVRTREHTCRIESLI